jgi:sucrose-6-phosphate hydrolase SacC (GH32 family)
MRKIGLVALWPDGGMHWKHAMERIDSKDFLHWFRPRLLLAPNDQAPAWGARPSAFNCKSDAVWYA